MSAPTVATFMSSPVVAVGIDASLTTVSDLMRAHAISSVLVTGQKGPVGVLSRTDLLQVAHVRHGGAGRRPTLELPGLRAGDLMTPSLVSVELGCSLAEAAGLMVARHIHRVFVRDGIEIVGVFSTKDAMRAVLHARVAAPISSRMSAPVLSVQANDTVASAVDQLARAGVAGLVVMDDQRAIGLFSQEEVLESRHQDVFQPVEQAMTQSLVCLPIDTPLFRAAGFAVATRARRVLAVEHHLVRGILTGIDFAHALAER